ncbi:MAG: LPS export ABC transporter permease LptG [Proteobacteria bacterium]|nr:LPS export ABC transporter permease LptG [Pseudomonadota bacterium]
MTLRPRLHDRLVARAVLASLGLVWAVLLGFDAIVAFANQLDDLGKGGFTLGHAVLYVVCTIPRRAYELFPWAALIASLLGVGGLAATSELTALRSAGISRLRICLGAVAGLALVTLVMMVSAETIGPWGEQTAEAIQVSAKTGDLMVGKGGGIWARDGQSFVNARGGAKRLRGQGRERIDLLDVRVFAFADDGVLQSFTHADKAQYDQHRWTLVNVDRTAFVGSNVTRSTAATQDWPTGLRPQTVLAGVQPPRYQPTRELRSNIAYMQRNKVDAGEYQNAFWARRAYPLNVLAMCLAVLPFAFGQLRSGGFGKRLFVGILCGMGFFLLQRFTQNIATIYHLPLAGAHLGPPLLALVVSRWYFRQRV